MSVPDKHTHIKSNTSTEHKHSTQRVLVHLFSCLLTVYIYYFFKYCTYLYLMFFSRSHPSLSLTLTSAAAALKLIFATDSLFRRRGSLLRPERELVKEQSEAAPGVIGV